MHSNALPSKLKVWNFYHVGTSAYKTTALEPSPFGATELRSADKTYGFVCVQIEGLQIVDLQQKRSFCKRSFTKAKLLCANRRFAAARFAYKSYAFVSKVTT